MSNAMLAAATMRLMDLLPKRKVFPVVGSSANGARVLAATAVALLCFAAPAVTARAGLSPAEVTISAPVYKIDDRSLVHANERWTIDFQWSGIPVGSFQIELRQQGEPPEERLHVDVQGRTSSVVDLLWRYRIHATGSIRLQPFAPGDFLAQELENRKSKMTRIEFTPDRHVHALRQKGDRTQEFEFKAPNTFDILSTVFLVLNLDHRVGDQYYVDTLTGASRYLITISVDGRESVEAGGKKVDAFRLLLESSELTDPKKEAKHSETLFWVSAGEPRRLLRAKSKTFVGAISGRLASVDALDGARKPAEQPPATPRTSSRNRPPRPRAVASCQGREHLDMPPGFP